MTQPAATPEKIYNYTVTIKAPDGTISDWHIDAVDDGHAFEEASYEFEGECIAVKRGEFMYFNELPPLRYGSNQ